MGSARVGSRLNRDCDRKAWTRNGAVAGKNAVELDRGMTRGGCTRGATTSRLTPPNREAPVLIGGAALAAVLEARTCRAWLLAHIRGITG